MSGAAWTLVMAAAALLVIACAATRVPGVARVFLIAQVAYWSLSYVARPATLLWVNPAPRYGDSLADPRLSSIGYDLAIENVMRPVVFGLWFYALLVVAVAIWFRGRPTPEAKMFDDARFIPTMWVAYGLGSVGRIASYFTGATGVAGEVEASNVALDFLSALATIGALGLIVFLRSEKRVNIVAVIALLFAVELLWTVLTQSKTPVVGAALTVAIRFAITGWSRARLAGVVAIAGFGLGGFGWLQSFKETAADRVVEANIDQNYPEQIRPFLSILRRFDLVSAATDTYYMNGMKWLSPGQVIQHAIDSFIPAQLLGREKFTAGVRWAAEVRGSSLDMRNVSTALAEGNINEGYLIGGYVGIVITGTFILGMVLLWSRVLYSGSIIMISIALAVVEYPILFERGVMGNMEVIGKYLQVAFLVWLIYLCIGRSRRRPDVDVGNQESATARLTKAGALK